MRKLNILGISICVLLASAAWIPADSSQDTDAQKQILELKKQVESLEKRIEDLEKKVQFLASNTRVDIPENFPQVQKVPDNWHVFEYNGMKYYSIPLTMEKKETKKEKK